MFRICSSFSATVESPQRVRERTSEGGSRVMVPSIFAWGHIVPAVAPHGPGLPDIAWHSPGVVRSENGRFPPVCRPLRDHLTRKNGAQKSLTCRSEEHTSELQSLMRISYAVFCLKKKKSNKQINIHN